jgi:hypothetical protein
MTDFSQKPLRDDHGGQSQQNSSFKYAIFNVRDIYRASDPAAFVRMRGLDSAAANTLSPTRLRLQQRPDHGGVELVRDVGIGQ